MSSPPRQPALLPLYATRFECAREKCADTCCSGWKITVDSAACERFHALPSSPARDRMISALVPSEPAAEKEHAWVRPAAGSLACPMLEGGLCGVHKTLGTEALPDGCFSFPRFTRSLADELSMGMSLACPVAAKLALLAPDAFEFVEGDLPLRERTVTTVPLPEGLSPDAARDVRAFCLDLLRARAVAPWARLALVGLLCERLTGLLASARASEVPALLESFRAELPRPGVRNALEAVVPRVTEQVEVCAVLLRTGTDAPPSPHQQRVLDAVMHGLDPAALAARFQTGLARLDESLAAVPHLLEHYLLNELFREAFPFERETPSAHFFDLAARFGLLRFVLALRCAEGPLPTPEELADTVQVFSRRWQHDPNFAQEARSTFRERGWDDMGHFLSFLRA